MKISRRETPLAGIACGVIDWSAIEFCEIRSRGQEQEEILALRPTPLVYNVTMRRRADPTTEN